MKLSTRLKAAAATVLFSLMLIPASARDVRGYSVIKGHFLNQTGPSTLATDPDFGFSILASVDLNDFDLVTQATFEPPKPPRQDMDNLGDSWDFLDSFETLAALNAAYGWGNYTLNFTTVHDGKFSCVLPFPNTPLPPNLKLRNFAEVDTVNSARPLTLEWDYSAAAAPGDFVQVYVTEGHATIFSTPDIGEPDALDSTAHAITIPAGTFEPGAVYSINLEITRVVSTNNACDPGSQGVTGTFSSTSIDMATIVPPEITLLALGTNGMLSLEVIGEPARSTVLQGSDNLLVWSSIATNASSSGTNRFDVPLGPQPARFFRAGQP